MNKQYYIIFGIILFVVIIGGGAWFIFLRQENISESRKQAFFTDVESVVVHEEQSGRGFLKHMNDMLGYTIEIPDWWNRSAPDGWIGDVFSNPSGDVRVAVQRIDEPGLLRSNGAANILGVVQLSFARDDAYILNQFQRIPWGEYTAYEALATHNEGAIQWNVQEYGIFRDAYRYQLRVDVDTSVQTQYQNTIDHIIDSFQIK